MARVETPTMALVSERLQHKVGKDLKTYLTEARNEQVDQGDGTMARATWDDVAFNIRTVTGMRVVRESVRNWAQRYGIKEPEHDYGVDPATGEPRSDAEGEGSAE
jgi:hypothetical protein